MTMSFLRTDVTAVCLHENFILAGIGHSVFVFNKTTCQFIKKHPVLVGQKVHGFAPQGADIAASGGKQIAVITLREIYGKAEDNEVLLKRICHLECDDWILHTIWTNADKIAALTAHNVVQVWNVRTHRLLQQYSSEDNSILYSGLLEQLEDDLLVLAGTVFSQVIVHRCGCHRRLQVLEGHKGVIFSIAWDPTKEIIVTTSDDRSVRLWSPNSEMKQSPKLKEYWETCNMVCKHIVYGHLSRVMGCSITPSMIVSVGEDSHVCFWDFSGKLLKKVKSHQNGCIWSLHSDSRYVLTGGSDSGVVLHPLSLATEKYQSDTLIGPGTPKRIMFTARGNIVAYFATDKLCYFDTESNQWQDVATYDDTYKIMALSSCKQLLAIVDANGNLEIFIENYKNTHFKKFLFRKFDIGKICSLHWAGNRFLVVCSDDGNVTVASSDCESLRSFLLPACKERWLTASAVNASQDVFVLGDRCGNVHFFYKDKTPMKTFRKVHGNYGPTTISWRDSSVCTTGRDGTIRYFSVKKYDGKFEIRMKHQLNVPFQWVERFVDDRGLLVCGFNERNFVVHSLKDGRSMIDVACGGGHRAWDIRRYFEKSNEKVKEFIKLIYVKDSAVQTAIFDMDMITPRTVVSGSHVKEINCLDMFIMQDPLDGEIPKEVFFVAGGEDTTIRLSSHEPNSNDLNFCDRLIFKELSSIRSIALHRLNESEILLVSGGGRAKISIRLVHFERSGRKIDLEAENIIEYQIKDTKERKNTSWKSDFDIDPETRIMSLQIINKNKTHIILAGCSDSVLRIFKYDHTETTFEPFGQINYHKTCILIVHHFENNAHNLVFTATTTGEIAVWDLSFLANDSSETDLGRTIPLVKLNVRRSGINSLSVKCTNDNWLLATGGDDNSVHLVLLKLKEKDDYSSMCEISRWSTSSWHNAQVTGLKFLDEYLISASIDQRITISRVLIQDDVVLCEYVEQLYTDVADVQGLEVIRTGDSIDLCVYGKGIEVVRVKIARFVLTT